MMFDETRERRGRFFGSMLRATPWLEDVGPQRQFQVWVWDFACGCLVWTGLLSGEAGPRKVCPRHQRVLDRLRRAA